MQRVVLLTAAYRVVLLTAVYSVHFRCVEVCGLVCVRVWIGVSIRKKVRTGIPLGYEYETDELTSSAILVAWPST